MQLRKWTGLALCMLLVFALLLGGCIRIRIPAPPPNDPGGQEPQEPVDAEDPPDEPSGEEPPPLTELTLADLELMPYSIIYLDMEDNLIQLNLKDKSHTVLAQNVQAYVPDLANNQLAMAIADPEGELYGQGGSEIVLYSTSGGSTKVLGASYIGHDLHFSPNGNFLAVVSGVGQMDIYDLETGTVYDAEDENLEVAVNRRPVWTPSGMTYAMPMIYIWEKAGPPGIYIIDPVKGERTAVLEVDEKKARPHSWLDQSRLLIEYELEPYTWVNISGQIIGLLGENYVPGEFKILDISTGEMSDAEAPNYTEQASDNVSPDGRWILHSEDDETLSIMLLNTETNDDYTIAEGHSPLWLADN